MGTEPSASGGHILEEPVLASVLDPACRKLVAARDYGRLADLLDASLARAQTKALPQAAGLITAARGLCQACLDCRVQEAHHQRSYDTAVAREDELHVDLQRVLGLLDEGAGRGQSEGAVESGEHRPGFWQRAREILGLEVTQEKPLSETDAEKTTGDPMVADSPHSKSIGGTSSGIVSTTNRLTAEDEAHQFADDSLTELGTTNYTSISSQIATVMSRPLQKGTHSLVIYCLGPFRVYQNSQLISDWNGLKGLAILKYMIAQGGKAISKDILMEVIWPESSLESARRNLHQAVYSLRQALNRNVPDIQHIQFQNDSYLLNPEITMWIDLVEFENQIRKGRQYEADGKVAQAIRAYGAAEALYQGDLLEEDLYENWTVPLRTQLRGQYFDVAEKLSDYHIQKGDYSAAIALCQKVLVRDRCHESAHFRIMQSYIAQDQRYMAIRQYQHCAQAMEEELAILPGEQVFRLYQEISRQEQAPEYQD